MATQPNEAQAQAPVEFVMTPAPPKQNLWTQVLAQLQDVSRQLDLDPGIVRILSSAERELKTSTPVRRPWPGWPIPSAWWRAGRSSRS